ncbi:hypothetical protein K501DRAFT_281432 [Backusella circina FSU 941]|nr:hypothetical protein K501DRAFT_281432 [Backusella circina FSU 941]
MQIKFTLFSVLTALFIATEAAPTSKDAQYVFEIIDEQSFCAFMPPHPGDDVAGTEDDGIPFCTKADLGGQVFPDGFIETVKFVKEDTYVQVRATFNREAYSLSASDDGGQYDYHDVSAQCKGYDYFVNILGPSDELFCIRCCQDREDCNINKSTEGCDAIMPDIM